MRVIQPLLVIALAVAMSPVQASVIEFATGFSNAGAQSSALDYQALVEAAVAVTTPGYGSGWLTSYDGVSNQSLYGANTNIAFKSEISFNLALAGFYQFRAGVDFGHGGAFFMDGQALGFKSNDMWWAGSYANPSQHFAFGLNLTAGLHQIQLYGLEGCCDGAQQVQFKGPNDLAFKSFSNTDGLDPVSIPEPASFALLLLGLGGVGLTRRKAAE